MVRLFISDLHLDVERPDLIQAFLRFCENDAREAHELYILGDLVDAWLGDDDHSEIPSLVTNALAELNQNDVKVHVMPGNRDFLYGEQFAKAAACSLLPDPTIININNEATLIMHGDSLCTDDKAYMAFRSQIRNPDMQALLLAKPLEERRAIAKQLRNQSKSANARKAEDIMDVNQQEVTDIMNKYDVKRLIHGHTHRPKTHEFKLNGAKATRIVLGDWDTKGWVLRITHDDCLLTSFPII